MMAQLLEFVSNHPVLFVALGVVILAFIANEVHGRMKGDRRLSPSEAVRLINHEDALVIDVRAAADFKRGHILHARHIVANRIAEHLGELVKFKERPVLCYCALGTSAPQVCETLRQQGFSRAYSLKGGLNAWQGANLPTTLR